MEGPGLSLAVRLWASPSVSLLLFPLCNTGHREHSPAARGPRTESGTLQVTGKGELGYKVWLLCGSRPVWLPVFC